MITQILQQLLLALPRSPWANLWTWTLKNKNNEREFCYVRGLSIENWLPKK